ncbi:MAG: hypothetical protein ACE5OZ_07965 [Candidatus Heimdallarchaeota archaeon]
MRPSVWGDVRLCGSVCGRTLKGALAIINVRPWKCAGVRVAVRVGVRI